MTLEYNLHQSSAQKQWQKIGVRPHHGICIPLFSLRSQKSCGIGEFTDLLPLFPWCKEVGLDTIQLLPLNDTGIDTSPYSALSANALNPIHLGLAQLPHVDEDADLRESILKLQYLDRAQRIDYSAVRRERELFLREYQKRNSHRLVTSPDYASFVAQNPWLKEYALFKVLKIERQWQDWAEWPDAIRNSTYDTFHALCKEYEEKIAYHICVQYLCFRQFQQVKQCANENGIFLKGDVPILIGRQSADVWMQRNFFITEFSAGAPPDMYAKDGQDWGFPIYDWTELAKDDYKWWKQRLSVASRLYDIYRIDHVVGFFRIWAIPHGKKAVDGHFIPEEAKAWIRQGEKIMRMMLENCPMLPIGEDLGTVPDEVRACLDSLGICGTKVMRWERLWEKKGQPFIQCKEYSKKSMTTVSTHDSETLKLWWRNNPQEAKEYASTKGWHYTAELDSEKHFHILWESHRSNSLFHINLLQEYLALVSNMTWPNPEDERINFPSTVSDRNWSYRFRPFVEEIVSSTSLRDVMNALVKNNQS